LTNPEIISYIFIGSVICNVLLSNVIFMFLLFDFTIVITSNYFNHTACIFKNLNQNLP
jgi:hypothetical protein